MPTPKPIHNSPDSAALAAAHRTFSQNIEAWPPPVAWCFGHYAAVDMGDELVCVESVMTSPDEAIIILRLRKPQDGQEYGVELRLPGGVIDHIDGSLIAGMTLAEIGTLEPDGECLS